MEPENVQGEIVNPRPDIAWRDDEVGRLARAVAGILDPNVPPDPTAVPPLIDALMAVGYHRDAASLVSWLVNIAQQYDRVGPDYAMLFSRVFMSDWGYLTRDLYSAAALMAARVTESLKPVPVVPSQESQVASVRTHLNDPRMMRVGRRVVTPDGVRGIVAAVNSDGTCDVVSINEADDESGPMELTGATVPGPRHPQWYSSRG
jgi:hypothetical protein